MSPARRVALGLGIVLLATLVAWPFRRDAAPELTRVADRGDNVLSLSQGVSLQMPGQQATVPLPARPNPPSPTDVTEDANPDEVERSVQADVAALTQPPALPDHYRPLFKPPSIDDRAGRLNTPDSARARSLRRHTIHDGDTLEGLAARYLGNSGRAAEILELNRQILSDPQLLPIGVTISIPSREPGTTGAAPAENLDLVPLPTNGIPWNR